MAATEWGSGINCKALIIGTQEEGLSLGHKTPAHYTGWGWAPHAPQGSQTFCPWRPLCKWPLRLKCRPDPVKYVPESLYIVTSSEDQKPDGWVVEEERVGAKRAPSIGRGSLNSVISLMENEWVKG